MTPTHVQWPFVLDIQDLPIQIAGTVDVREGLAAIRDTKTSTKSPNKGLAETSLQLTMYSLAILAHEGAIPAEVALDYLVRTPKRKDLKLVQLLSRRVESDMPHLLERIATANRIIQSGLFTPAPLEAWWCSQTFCPYHRACKYAAHPVSSAGGVQ